MKHRPPTTLMILTGYSGSGKTTALRVFEELGYYCVDNIPLPLMPDLIRLHVREHPKTPLAVVIDARNREYLEHAEHTIKQIKTDIKKAKILFFDTDHESVTRRYKQTRLSHPLSRDGSIGDGYRIEKKLLAPLHHMADVVIRTTDSNVDDLKRAILQAVGLVGHDRIHVEILSFGYKHGMPHEADIVLDVRFLKNPFFDKKLHSLTGQSAAVRRFVKSDAAYTPFIKKTWSYLQFLLLQFERKQKTRFVVAFGCTGGIHRSVTIANQIHQLLKSKNIPSMITHRDIQKEI